MNELVSSHESASNDVINVEGKTEREITELSKEYADLAEQIREEETILNKIEKSNEKTRK